MFQTDLFKGHKILVTGGGTGLGRAMSERLLQLGAHLVICGRRKGVLDATAAELVERHGGKRKLPRSNHRRRLPNRRVIHSIRLLHRPPRLPAGGGECHASTRPTGGFLQIFQTFAPPDPQQRVSLSTPWTTAPRTQSPKPPCKPMP